MSLLKRDRVGELGKTSRMGGMTTSGTKDRKGANQAMTDRSN